MRNLKVVFYARLYAPAPLQAELGRSLSHCILGLVVLLLGGWTLFFHLGEGSLNDWDEATYAEIAREMVTRGDWITPYWNGAPFHDKPPLVMWFMAAGLTIIKSPELAARLPSAIAGLFAIATTILLGRVLFCLWTGLTAAVLLLVSSKSWWVNFVMLARQGMLDVPLTGFTIWAFLHLYRGIQRPQHWLLMGLPLGLAMLTKSFLTLPIVLTIVIFVIVLVLQGQPFSRMHWRYAAGCVTLALTVSLPWHLVQVVQHGNDFFDGYVLIHFLKTQRPEAGNLGAKSFYLIAIGQALPYLAWLGVPAIAFAVWRILRFRDNRALLLAVWIAVPLLLLRQFQPNYLGMLFPFSQR
jgi:4-amino-4-deoxy-L-arabinose transferase-like glycosyltransferase